MGPENHKPETLDYATPQKPIYNPPLPIPPDIKQKMKHSLLWAIGFLALWAILAASQIIFSHNGYLFCLKTWAQLLAAFSVLAGIFHLFNIGRYLLMNKRIPLSLLLFTGLLIFIILGFLTDFMIRPPTTVIRQFTATNGKTYYSMYRTRTINAWPVLSTDRVSYGFADSYINLNSQLRADDDYFQFLKTTKDFKRGEFQEGVDGRIYVYGFGVYDPKERP